MPLEWSVEEAATWVEPLDLPHPIAMKAGWNNVRESSIQRIMKWINANGIPV